MIQAIDSKVMMLIKENPLTSICPVFDQDAASQKLVKVEPRAARPLPAAAAGPVSRAKDAGPNCDRILGQRKAAPLLWTAADMFRRAD